MDLSLDTTLMAYSMIKYAIYMATIDYMIASYGPYAASATGGNGFARDFLAGIAAMYSMPSKWSQSCNRISPDREIQCIWTWVKHTTWNGLPPSWASWRSYSLFQYTYSIGKVLGFENCRHSRRPWLPTERRLAAGFLPVVPVIQILLKGICLNVPRRRPEPDPAERCPTRFSEPSLLRHEDGIRV